MVHCNYPGVILPHPGIRDIEKFLFGYDELSVREAAWVYLFVRMCPGCKKEHDDLAAEVLGVDLSALPASENPLFDVSRILAL